MIRVRIDVEVRVRVSNLLGQNFGVHDRLHIYSLCGIFYFPWHRHKIKWTHGFSVSSERHWQSLYS